MFIISEFLLLSLFCVCVCVCVCERQRHSLRPAGGTGPRSEMGRRGNPAFESELREGVCVGGNFSGLVVNMGDGKEKGGGDRSGVGWMDRSGRSGRGDGSMLG